MHIVHAYDNNTNDTNMFKTKTNFEIVEIPDNWFQPECPCDCRTARVIKSRGFQTLR